MHRAVRLKLHAQSVRLWSDHGRCFLAAVHTMLPKFVRSDFTINFHTVVLTFGLKPKQTVNRVGFGCTKRLMKNNVTIRGFCTFFLRTRKSKKKKNEITHFSLSHGLFIFHSPDVTENDKKKNCYFKCERFAYETISLWLTLFPSRSKCVKFRVILNWAGAIISHIQLLFPGYKSGNEGLVIVPLVASIIPPQASETI